MLYPKPTPVDWRKILGFLPGSRPTPRTVRERYREHAKTFKHSAATIGQRRQSLLATALTTALSELTA